MPMNHRRAACLWLLLGALGLPAGQTLAQSFPMTLEGYSVASQLTTATEDVGDWVYLASGSTSHDLRRTTASGRTVYQATSLASDDWVRNASWNLTVPGGGPWGAFDLSGVVRTTQGFDSVQPAAILNDGAQAFTAAIHANSATFSWSPSGVADSFVTIVDVYSSNGSTYLGGVLCHSDDTGSVTLPAAGLAYPSGALLAIYMYRYQVEQAENAVDGSAVQGISTIGLAGTGVLR